MVDRSQDSRADQNLAARLESTIGLSGPRDQPPFLLSQA
jgi:hypothetical protein